VAYLFRQAANILVTTFDFLRYICALLITIIFMCMFCDKLRLTYDTHKTILRHRKSLSYDNDTTYDNVTINLKIFC